jgi:hypothetical protein
MSKVLMGFVGDVFINRDNPQEVFGEVRDILQAPNIMFANLEGIYTDTPLPVLTAPSLLIGRGNNLNAFAEAGFDVVSLANNHVVDAGYKNMLENRSRLRTQGIKTCGAGESLADAREPAIMEVDGLRIAFLAYASVFPFGYDARPNRPGLVPMRAYNFWREPFATTHSPGTYPLVTTIPDEGDLAQLTEDIRRARERADLVITSFHWGDYTCRFHLTDHEKRTARHCIDQGAAMVVGHHHHTLRGMEWYRGKPIMYGLGHFVFDMQLKWSEADLRTAFARSDADTARFFEQTYWREGWWPFGLHDDSHLTAFAWATASRTGVTDIGFLPCKIAPHGVVRPLRLNSSESDEVVKYMQECNRTQGLKSRITADSSMTLAGFPALRVDPE